MAKIPHVRPGDPITADLWNAVAEQLERFANLTVAGRYLRLWSSPTGKCLAAAFPQPTWARLSGSSSPYSFVEVRDGAGGTWEDLANGDIGTANVYEINGKAGLAGKVVPITWTAAGDWRFQWVGYGSAPCESGRICVTVGSDGCSPAEPVVGAAVTVTGPGEFVASCVSDGSGECCVDIPQAGTYLVTVQVAGAEDQTESVAAVCGVDNPVSVSFPADSLGTVCFSFLRCTAAGTVPVDGAGVTTSGQGIATGTGDASGSLCLRLGVGSYSASVSYPGVGTHAVDFDVFACATTEVTVTSITVVCFQATSNAPGCTADITVTNDDTAAVLGSGSLTTTFDGVLYTGSACIAITEIFVGDFISFGYDVDWPLVSYHASAVVGCYSSSIPLNADPIGAGC